MGKKSKELNFEEALEHLEEHVRKLESGNLSLDDSLKVFEEGTGFARACEAQLSAAKGKVEKLLQQAGGGVETEPFEIDEG